MMRKLKTIAIFHPQDVPVWVLGDVSTVKSSFKFREITVSRLRPRLSTRLRLRDRL